MCGIAGIIQSNPGLYNQEHLKKMTAALAYRGPDGEGIWQNESGHALLGHRRLSVIDLTDAAAQPMHYMDRYTIIHNGEIYNYIELKEELRKKGYGFQTRSDTEVILAAYDCWNDECVDHFDGMFAFAIWDEKEKELFAARDRFGEKPFFYFSDGEQFIFGSEIKAIWAAGIKRTANLKMLFNFITIGYTDNPNQPAETFFESIYKLPAAGSLKYSPVKKELITEEYWDIDPEIENKKITPGEAVEQFTELFSQSIKRRLRSDVATGTSLSGGIDSSSIAAISSALRVPGEKYKCFTAAFPGFEKDESVFSKQVANQFGLQQFITPVSPGGLADEWETLMHHQEEPISSASVYAQFKVFELARQQDVKVLLDGQGADEVLGGYFKYYKWYWQELFHKRKLLKSGELKASKKLGIPEKFGFKNIVATLFPDLASVILERQYLLKALRQEDLEKDFIRLQSKEAYYTTPVHFTLNGVLYFNTCIHGLEELLRYADRNAMAHGRELRLPFLDHELVQFIFSLPSNFKIRNGYTKWLLRESMNSRLPETISWRTEKIGFEPPQLQWMQEKKLQEMIRVAKQKLVTHGILRKAALDKPVRPMNSYDADNYDWRYLSAATSL